MKTHYLRPCPFCGTTPAGIGPETDDWSKRRYWAVGCEPCGYTLRREDTPEEAAASWNRRPEADHAVAALKALVNPWGGTIAVTELDQRAIAAREAIAKAERAINAGSV